MQNKGLLYDVAVTRFGKERVDAAGLSPTGSKLSNWKRRGVPNYIVRRFLQEDVSARVPESRERRPRRVLPPPTPSLVVVVPQLVQLLHQTEAMSTTLREILAGLHHAADPAPPRAIPALTPSAEGGT